jgi:hypothetical protein
VAIPVTLPSVHLDRLCGASGIAQFADGRTPDWTSGTCVDDVARLLLVDRAARSPRRDRIARSTAFLCAMADSSGLSMHNMATIGGVPCDATHVGDHVGRAIWALAAESDACELVQSLSEAVVHGEHLRPLAYACIGSVRARQPSPASEQVIERAGEELHAALSRCGRWFEPRLTYDCGRLPQALMEAGRHTGRVEWLTAGRRALCHLDDAFVGDRDLVRAVGHLGAVADGRDIEASGDEQPLEIAAFAAAHRTAWRSTRLAWHAQRGELCTAWFHGRNRARRPVVCSRDGACHDGVHDAGVNANCGAESTLAAHEALR